MLTHVYARTCMFLTRCHELPFPATRSHLSRGATFAPNRRWPLLAGTTVVNFRRLFQMVYTVFIFTIVAALLHVGTVHLLVCSQPCYCLFGTRLPFGRRLLFPLVYPYLALLSMCVCYLSSSHARTSSIVSARFVWKHAQLQNNETWFAVKFSFVSIIGKMPSCIKRLLLVVSHRLLDIKMQNIEYIIPRTSTMRNAMLTLGEETNECSTSTL